MSDTKKPAAKANAYPITVALWRNETKNGTFYKIKAEETYRDANGEFKTTDNIDASQALLAAKLFNEIDTEWRKLRAADAKARRENEAA